MKKKIEIAKRFGLMAKEYEKHMHESGHVKVQYQILGHFKNYLRENCLDIATGTGSIATKLMEFNPEKKIIGIDSSKKMIEYAKILHPNVIFKVEDALSMQYSNKFDVIVSSLIFNWIDSPGELIIKIHKALKNGSYYLLLEERYYEEFKQPFLERNENVKRLRELENILTLDEIQKKIIPAGFNEIGRINFDIDGLHEMIGILWQSKHPN